MTHIEIIAILGTILIVCLIVGFMTILLCNLTIHGLKETINLLRESNERILNEQQDLRKKWLDALDLCREQNKTLKIYYQKYGPITWRKK